MSAILTAVPTETVQRIGTVEQSYFRDALRKSSAAISTKSQPILQNLLLQTDGDRMHITCTDLDKTVRTTIPMNVIEPMSLCADAKTLTRFVEMCDNTGISLELIDEHRLRLLSGKSKIELGTLPADDFPQCPSLDGDGNEWFSCQGKDWAQWVSLVVPFCAKEETRGVLVGALLECSQDGDFAFVATDTHRLSLLRREPVIHNILPFGIIVPSGVLKSSASLFGESASIEVQATESQIAFSDGDTTFISRILDGKFPPYEKVIPKAENCTWVGFNTDDLLRAMKRISLSAADDPYRVALTFEGENLTLASANANAVKSGVETVPIERNDSGPELSVAFNSRYLLDALTAFAPHYERMELGYTGQLTPMLLCPTRGEVSQTLYVAMPMNI